MSGYDYIYSAYGIRFTPGDRVEFTEGKRRLGVVKRPKTNFHYVTVQFDDGTTGLCHPKSLEHVKETAS